MTRANLADDHADRDTHSTDASLAAPTLCSFSILNVMLSGRVSHFNDHWLSGLGPIAPPSWIFTTQAMMN